MISVSFRAHPRSRGDHGSIASGAAGAGGSSPLARGPLHKNRMDILDVGLIPARAGTTIAVFRHIAVSWAHPRSRGDHQLGADIMAYQLGSSPLARGPRFW